jgi:hypothetical protein
MNRKETTLALVAETEIHGFKFPESRNNSEWGKSLTKKMGRVRENPTNRLSLLSEQEVLSSPPDTTAGHTVIQMPGHEGEHFAIIDDYFTSPPYRGKKVLPLKAICLDLRLSLPRNLSVVRPGTLVKRSQTPTHTSSQMKIIPFADFTRHSGMEHSRPILTPFIIYTPLPSTFSV